MHLAAARSGARRIAVAIAVMALAVAACGDDDETADSTDTTDTTSVDSTAVDTTLAEAAGSATTAAGTDSSSRATTAGGGDTTGAGDDVDRSEEAYVATGAEALALGDEEQSRCIAQAIVDAVGYDQLEASGITPEEFNAMGSLSEAGLVVDDAAGPQLRSDLLACGAILEALASSSALTPEQADCLREHLTDELVAESFVIRVLESEPSPEYADAATNAQECAAG